MRSWIRRLAASIGSCAVAMGALSVGGEASAQSTLAGPPAIFAFPTMRLDRIVQTHPFVSVASGIKASEAPSDIEGLAYDPVRNSIWIADDSKHRLWEVDYATGALVQFITQSQLEAVPQYNVPAPAPVAGADRVRDLEGIAYDAVTDRMYVVAGPCCPAKPSLPTVFELTRGVNGRFAPTSFQPLVDGLKRDFADMGIVNGEVWLTAGQRLIRYDYATNTFGAEVPLSLRNNINGIAFSDDGSEVWVTTSDEVLRRFAWPSETLMPNHVFPIETLGLRDSRALVLIGDKLMLGDGYDLYPPGAPNDYALHVFSITNDAPSASFAVSPGTDGGAPFKVTIDDTTSFRPAQLTWDFDDGSPLLTQTIPTDETALPADKSRLDPTPPFVHEFTAARTYNVKLTATNPNGSSTVTRTITVTNRPSAAMALSPTSGRAPLTVTADDLSTATPAITARRWTFGDGTPDLIGAGNAEKQATHTFDAPGVYTVTLGVTNDSGTSTTSQTINVNGPPSAGFTSDVVTGTAPLDVSFTNTSAGFPAPNAWLWDFGDGTAPVTDENPAHVFAYPGTYTVTMTATNSVSSTTTTRVYIVKGSFAGYGPIRLMDTRNSDTIDGLYRGEGRIAGGATRSVAVIGRGGVPATGVGSVALNITAVGGTKGSYLTVYPQGKDRPYASNLNFTPGQAVANMVIVPVGTNGNVTIFNEQGEVHVIVDLLGWFPSGPVFTGLTPARLMDTRNSPTVDRQFQGGGMVGPASSKVVQVLGRGRIPLTGVGSVVLNVTVVDGTAPSFLTIWPKGRTKPVASNLNWQAGATVPNMVIVPVPDDGELALYNESGSVHVVVDVLGWFPKGPVFTGVAPARLLDTRAGTQTIDGQARGIGPIAAGQTYHLKVTGRLDSGVPETGVGAVALNVTSANPSSESYLTVFEQGKTRPNASNLNLVPGRVVPNMVIVPVGPNGEVSIFNERGTTDVIVDVLGWFPTTV